MNPNKLRATVIAKGYSMKSFAEKIRIKRSAFYRKLNGTSEFDRAEMERIITVLELTAEQVNDIFFNE